MKFVKAKEKVSKADAFGKSINKVKNFVVFAYLFCMLGIFPLYYKEQYYAIGDAKFEFFWNISLSFIGIYAIIFLIKRVLCVLVKDNDAKVRLDESVTAGNSLIGFLDNLSFLDYVVLVYGICVLLSYAFSDFKSYAFKGAAGWTMGLCTQMIFIAVYYILSRQEKLFGTIKLGKVKEKYQTLAKLVIGIHLISSALTFLFGILHRFEIDPLGMYVGLELYQKIEFLSTIGQATWFSGYVCSVFTVGVTLFYISEQKWLRTLTGIYSVISFGILVTQNSDSAFIAVAGIMLLLGYFSLSDIRKWCRFWQIMTLMWGTFAGIGVLQRVFADRAVPLDSLSVFFSQSAVTWVMFSVSVIVMLFYSNCYKKRMSEKHMQNSKKNTELTDNHKVKEDNIMAITKAIYKGIVFLVAAVVILTIIFIYLNTKGYLLQWFDYQSTHHYLLFDGHWGSNRGSTWMICWQAFMKMPFYQKLFGVGPDSVSAYLYNVPEIRDLLYSLWGNMRLTNAHNEYLNSLLCYGVVGVTAWLAVLIGGIRYFYNSAKNNSFMIAFALCIMGYACHNIFCYQQVCATPFLFIALGIGESLTKSENFNTIK